MSAKPEFIEQVKNGNILARQCTKCSELHLATVYFCKKCGNKDFEDHIIAGKGKIVTYTIMTVPPEGFEEFAPYAWAVLELDDDSRLRISGFIPNIATPEDLPIGTPAEVVDFDQRGIVLKK
ncbi:MAG: nucleotide-binding protein [Thaumarchaeota archaeon]|nr:nucleotide-binding protein [Nitrososphaerota archaeon]